MTPFFSFIRSIMTCRLARGLSVDDPEFRSVSRQLIKNKPFLKKIYDEWYLLIISSLPTGNGYILEIGSGSGYCADLLPGVVTSDILLLPGIDMVLNACEHFPFEDSSLKAVVMVNSFHHLSIPEFFLRETFRCLRTGGRLIMIEPWVTPWSRLVYRKLHHEPFDPDVTKWEFHLSGPLSSANGAMPWIVFRRDQAKFEELFPGFVIKKIVPFMPFRYLLSGGVSMRPLMPGCLFGFWKIFETLFQWAAMFAVIEIEKK